jgi:hypothetical protein
MSNIVYGRIDMYESFDVSYEDIENILIEHWKKERMAYVQHEMLQMLVAFFTLFK